MNKDQVTNERKLHFLKYIAFPSFIWKLALRKIKGHSPDKYSAP